MSLLLLFGYPNPLSVPISELVVTAPSPGNGFVIQRPATSGEWRWVVELADTADGDSALWRDITPYYRGDRYQRGADEYLGRYRAAIATVELGIDDSDMLAPWGQDTSSIFGVDVRLDAGMLMRAGLIRVVSGVVEEWEPTWTGRVESWGDASGARGQVRTHVVTVIDTSADLANVPTQVIGGPDTWAEFFDLVLLQATWLFGIETFGDTAGIGLPDNDAPVPAINQFDNGTDPLGLVWRTLRSGKIVVYPAPWNTTHVDRYDNPLLDVYPDGLKFSYSPDTTDIEYIADDDQQPFGVERSKFGVINSIAITYEGDSGPVTFATDDPVSISRYGVRPLTANWVTWNGEQIVQDIIDTRAYATSQALPLRTTLDHEGFWSALAIVDHLDPVTVWHATQEAGLVVMGTGVIRNIVEERTFRGTDGDTSELNWQSTVQIDLDAVESTPALLPVEDLMWLSSSTPGFGGPSMAEFSWTNPVQPSVEPTEVQLRVLGRSFLWFSEDYPGVGADGTTLGWLESGRYYTLQVRLLRRVDGVVTHVSAIRQVRFSTPNNIFPTPIPGEDPTETDVDMPPFDDCQDDVSIELQENDGTGWVTVDTFSGTEIEQDDDGVWHLSVPIPNSFFNEGSMYRFLGFCGDDLIVTGPEFDPPDDWTDPCPEPAALSVPPFNDPSLLVYVPKVCTGFEDADPDFLFQGMLIIEAVSGIAGAHGDALDEILTGITSPTSHALLAIADPDWTETPGGILAYGECPQIVGAVGDKTWTVRANIAEAEECVLFECAGGRISCTPTSGGWRAVGTIYKPDLTITLPTASELDLDTPYVITLEHTLATGNIAIKVDDVVDNTVGGTDDLPTIHALPIWRVGAPPESWVTDCALFDKVFAPTTLYGAIQSFSPLSHWPIRETSGTDLADVGSLANDSSNAQSDELGDATAPDGFPCPVFSGSSAAGGSADDKDGYSPSFASGNTVVVAVKPVISGASGGVLVSKRADNGTVPEWEVGYNGTNGNTYGVTWTSGGGVARQITENAAMVNGVWALIIVRFDASGTAFPTLRINGVNVGTTSGSGTAATASTGRLQIGRRESGATQMLGSMAHVAIYAGELSDADCEVIEAAAVAEGWY